MPCQDYSYKRYESDGLKDFIENIKTNRKELSEVDIKKLERIPEKLDSESYDIAELFNEACSVLEDAEERSKSSWSATDKGLLVLALLILFIFFFHVFQ
jgi:hypothetical protein